MSMPIVAVSQRVDVWSERGERRDALDQALAAWLAVVGVMPAPVPNVLAARTLQHWLDDVAPAAVVLSGGNDIGAAEERDRTETILLNHAETCSIPVLGICRGSQMMAVRAGGRLKRVEGHVGARHRLMWAGRLDETTVNSYHTKSLADCPPGYRVLATAIDGEIEAFAHSVLPWEGWMWHPEREQDFCLRDIARAHALLTSDRSS